MTKFAFLLTVLWILSPALAIATIHSGTINGDVGQTTSCGVLSTSQAVGTVTFDDASLLFSWSYTYGDNASTFDNGALFNAGTETAAHFHGPALPGDEANVTEPTGPGTPDSGSATITAGEGTDLLAELWYLNIHSSNCGGGEIRGQVLFASPVPSSSIYGMAALLLGLVGLTTLAAYRWQRAS